MSNVRRSGVNGDVRAIEFVLAPEDHFEHTVMRGYVLTREPEPSVRDIEVVEHLAVWLGSDAGWDFIAGCEREIERRQAAAWRARWSRNDTTALSCDRGVVVTQ
jgi:hypothetical protein